MSRISDALSGMDGDVRILQRETRRESRAYFSGDPTVSGETNGRTGLPDPRRESPDGDYFDGNDLGLYDPLDIIVRNVWIIATCAMAVAIVALLASFLQPPTYESSVKLLVGQEGGVQTSESPASNLGNEVEGLQRLTETMVEGVTTRPVAESAIEELGLSESPEDLLSSLSASQIGDSQFIEVSYQDSDPATAQKVADSVGKNFSERISELGSNANSITASVWEEAALPASPIAPNIPRNTLLGAALGLMLGIGLAFMREFFSQGWRSPEEVETLMGVPTLGVIPTFKPTVPSGTGPNGSRK